MHELSITRYIDAPADKVWDVMANRQEEWWCPKPWSITLIEQDRRPGGRSAMIMHGPNGEEMPQDGVFLAWDEGRRFAATDAFDVDLVPSGPFMIGIWEVVPEGPGTRYTATARHWTEEARNQHAEMGFETGWGLCADQLQEICERG
ncbi:uncharacterized protein YndB with AHSA1/START domain [Novosphingobium hassiacum]|uniref:Uncharacterized protein YndB with AHSA1/START domain n=1 Tax=Novosphingobium hassiacum TaxID=173676 RepID=A0A7W5ZX99_9SPHN|nr:SRPBCC family protein [Novosphingobium hassiacum]MBB3861636.1 uncharacterized protein YndB with AHSA1/START domain [Novosphingobium hassiacum]